MRPNKTTRNKLKAHGGASLRLWAVRTTNICWMLLLTPSISAELSDCSCAFPLLTVLKDMNTKRSKLKREAMYCINILKEAEVLYSFKLRKRKILVPIQTCPQFPVTDSLSR